MELTIEEALRRAIGAHTAGKNNEAEQLYRAILRVQPGHADANHNLGVLALTTGQPKAAVELFKNALKSNQKVDQFWLSYIDGLVNIKDFEAAHQALTDARQAGISEDKLSKLERERLGPDQRENPSQSQKAQSLGERRKKAAKRKKKRKLDSISRIPSRHQVDNLLNCFSAGRFAEATKLATAFTQQFPTEPFGWKVLGASLEKMGNPQESLQASRKAVAFAPEDPEAHHNLGIALHDLGRLEAAEARHWAAARLKPNFAEAHAELSQLLFIRGEAALALESIKTAADINPHSQRTKLLLKVMERRAARAKLPQDIGSAGSSSHQKLINPPVILNRDIEKELLYYIYEAKSQSLDSTNDARFGNGICSTNFSFLEDSAPIIQKVAADLRQIMAEAVESEVFVFDSFFNILSSGGGTTPHHHLNRLDRTKLKLGDQKYSLVYYLSVGDQNCGDPGTLKLYSPNQEILPCEGMIVIIPSKQKHSASYGGKTDRVMIGANFYAL